MTAAAAEPEGAPTAAPRRGQRLRVVLVAHDIAPGGGMERAMYELIRGAHDRVDYTVVSGTLAEELRPLVRWRRVPIPEQPFPLKYFAFFGLAGLRYRRGKADLVHTLGAIIPRRADVMAVHFCHLSFQEANRKNGRTSRESWLRRVNTGFSFWLGVTTERIFTTSRWTRTATAVSESEAVDLHRFFPGQAVSVIPNGIDQERFQPSPDTRPQVRAELGVAPGDVVALFVGGRWADKGLLLVIKALAEARTRSSVPVRLWVAGPGDVNRYQAAADELGVGEFVTFLDFVPDVERLYQGADIFVLPSMYETFSMVAYEAASCGLPVVGTRVNGIDELLEDGTAGIMVEPTVDSVSYALSRLAVDASTRTRMGEAARARVQDNTWAAAADKTVELYEQLAGVTSGQAGRVG
jgi:glycosyltransferase involved in cell wall biosynthesis